eukprot:TRINITY_DN64238_c0_g2_i1.p1 TRINITY_DN64238_c0_g2~~TRINITY_DN64238_c0_g2_i1.p1  ORF type:complete len:507 (-),score=116.28 TRINITY_DN64238_c0_g2_i1:689-2209(-)
MWRGDEHFVGGQCRFGSFSGEEYHLAKMGLEMVFSVDSRHHGKGAPIFAWHPQSHMLATTGASRVVHLWQASGRLIEQILPSSSAPCIELAWQPPSEASSTSHFQLQDNNGVLLEDNNGNVHSQFDVGESSILAMLHEGCAFVTLYDINLRFERTVSIPMRDPCLLKWNPIETNVLAVGGGRGEMAIIKLASPASTRKTILAAGPSSEVMMNQASLTAFSQGLKFEDIVSVIANRNRKKITCMDWNPEGKLAFASDDKQIAVVDSNGHGPLAQVKLKSKPTCLQFGGSGSNNAVNTISVCLDRKTILLYNLNDPENALELAFQSKYGNIVSFQWFKDAFMMLGFSLGYFVVISTNLSEIGREQFCAKFHADNLKALSYCPVRQKVATIGESSVKIIDMLDWKENQEYQLEKFDGKLESVEWSKKGKLLSVGSRNGTVYTMEVEATELENLQAGDPSPVLMLLKPLSGLSLLIAIFVVVSMVLLLLSHVFDAPIDHLLSLFFTSLSF